MTIFPILVAVLFTAFLFLCAFINSVTGGSATPSVPPAPPSPAPRPSSPSLFFDEDWIGKRNHRHDATIERHHRSAQASNDRW